MAYSTPLAVDHPSLTSLTSLEIRQTRREIRICKLQNCDFNLTYFRGNVLDDSLPVVWGRKGGEITLSAASFGPLVGQPLMMCKSQQKLVSLPSRSPPLPWWKQCPRDHVWTLQNGSSFERIFQGPRAWISADVTSVYPKKLTT